MFHPKGPTLGELLRQGLSSTERGYDLLAPKFDYTPFRTPRPVLDVAARYIGGPGSMGRALDLCCGTGAAISMLRPICRELVVGVDISQGMLDEARRGTASAPGESQVELVRGDALNLPFKSAFDVVVCFGALGHILPEQEPRFVEQIAMALHPGGRFIFATGYLPSHAPPSGGSPGRSMARCDSAICCSTRLSSCIT